MSYDEVMAWLRAHADPANAAGMARFGISTEGTLGVTMPLIRELAKNAGRDHDLALRLWASGGHEGRLLAPLVEEVGRASREQIEGWVVQIESWDICDQLCLNLLHKLPYARELPGQWSQREEEFVRRAAFALIAVLAVHDKKADDSLFEGYLKLAVEASDDDRNNVKKAVNWALRQIGKRNAVLREKAVAAAEKIKAKGTAPARWIASDALRELNSERVLKKVGARRG